MLIQASILAGALPVLSLLRGTRVRGRALDLVFWFFTPLFTANSTKLAVGALLAGGALLLGDTGFGPVPDWPLWVQVAAALVVTDFVGYWMHRWFHTGALWRFHAVHHAPRVVDWLSSARLHPVNQLLRRGAQGLALLALGFPVEVLAPVIPILVLHGLLVHADVDWDFGPLRWVVVSPAFHRWHHDLEVHDTNFAGLFPVWDAVFRTAWFPRHERSAAQGIAEELPFGLIPQLLWALRRR